MIRFASGILVERIYQRTMILLAILVGRRMRVVLKVLVGTLAIVLLLLVILTVAIVLAIALTHPRLPKNCVKYCEQVERATTTHN